MEALTGDLLAALARSAPTKLDLTSPAQRESIEGMAVALAETADTLDGLREVAAAVAHDGALPMSVRVATKLALGRAMLEDVDEPVHVSVVIAVYKEHQRILTAKEHPVGEDFLREKLRQLRWLFRPTPRHDWDLTVVDDGCPEGSGRIARRILDEYARPDEEVEVLFLEDAIRDGLPIVASLGSTKESQKGGAIRLGLWHSTRASRVGHHVAAFSDADLSTHLAQLGLLVRPLTEPDHHAAIGSRREARSVVVKASKRDARGRLFIYLWKRLIPQLRGIVDTQCGFKAFEADHLATWIEDVEESGFSFDVEMLVRLQLVSPGSAKKVALAWIDSEAASTTAELEPYLPMLKRIVRLYRTVLPPTPSGERFATFIEGLDPDTFRSLAANVPQEIAARDPADFDDFAGVSPEQLRTAAGF
ncbi:MAG: hypothetical protein HKN72_05875 [Gemmatimonadetes bacterium]|nr:hypothetical protein [Gemmatimonadota bacterium]